MKNSPIIEESFLEAQINIERCRAIALLYALGVENNEVAPKHFSALARVKREYKVRGDKHRVYEAFRALLAKRYPPSRKAAA